MRLPPKLTSDTKSILASAPILNSTSDLTNEVARLSDPSNSQAALKFLFFE
jgi:hypothetical protein